MAGLPTVLKDFKSDEPAIGTILKSIAPNVAEALGYTPLDFLFIDRQHGSILHENLEHVIRAADINDIPVIVRIPSDDFSMITYLLDIGVSGIMIPQIEDAQTVIKASTHTRFNDGRSISTASRAAEFGNRTRSNYIDYVNQDVALIPQIETKAGVEVAEEVVKLDETSFIAIGPGDLSKSLENSSSSKTVQEAIDQIFDTANDYECGAGIFVGDQSAISNYQSDASFIIYRSDVGILMSHFDELLP